MFVLTLCRHLCPDKLPVEPDARLGDGADGEVLSIVGQPDKVLKLGILYELHNRGLQGAYMHIKNMLSYMAKLQPQGYVRVYESGYLGTFSRPMADWDSGSQKFIIYYYIMEKLQKISDDERKVFHSILSHEDRGIEKHFSKEKRNEMLKGMSRALDFDAEKVRLFCDNIEAAPLSHLDIHVRNIMKDSLGNFKLIDLDRIELENKYVKES